MLSWDLANKSDELLEASDVLDEETVRLRLGVREDAKDLVSSVGRVDVGELAIGLARVDGQRAHFFAGHWSLGNQIGQHELESGDVSSWLNRTLEVRDILESKFVKQRLLDFDIDYIFVYKVIIYPLQIRLEVSVETEHKALSSSLVSLAGTIWRKIEILLGIFGGIRRFLGLTSWLTLDVSLAEWEQGLAVSEGKTWSQVRQNWREDTSEKAWWRHREGSEPAEHAEA